jgi:DegV family protein with EDD domain
MAVSRVAVVTDSAASLPHEFDEAYGIATVPNHLLIGDEPLLDGRGESDARVAEALRSGVAVTTTAATPDDIGSAYRRVARAGAEAIVSIHVSSMYSTMLDNARAAASKSPVHVTLVDCGSTAMAQGLVVLAAAAIAAEGRTSDEVAGGALAVARSCRFLFAVDGFDYLRRGGRVSATVRAVGNLLHIHPVLSIHDGETTVVDRAWSEERAHHVVRSSMELYASTLAHPAACMGVQIGTAPEEALPLNIRGPVITVSVCGSLAAHTGPGTCGVAIAEMPPEFRRAHGGSDVSLDS